MFRKTICYLVLPLVIYVGDSPGSPTRELSQKTANNQTGTLEKLAVATARVSIDLDFGRLQGITSKEPTRSELRFDVAQDSYFTALVYNDAFRAIQPGSMTLVPRNSTVPPEPFNAILSQLSIERLGSTEAYDLVVRDAKTGFLLFNVEGHVDGYDAGSQSLSIMDGRLLISSELAIRLGRSGDTGTVVGKISITATMYPIEITTVAHGVVQSAKMPPRPRNLSNVPDVLVPGPDVIVGDLPSLQQFGSVTAVKSAWPWAQLLATTETSSSIGSLCLQSIIR